MWSRGLLVMQRFHCMTLQKINKSHSCPSMHVLWALVPVATSVTDVHMTVHINVCTLNIFHTEETMIKCTITHHHLKQHCNEDA